MLGRTVGAVALLLLAGAAPAASAGPLDSLQPLVAATESNAQLLVGATLGLGSTLVGAASPLVGVPLRSVLGAADRDVLVVLGKGTAVQHGIAGSCQEMQMVLEWHEPVSNEANLMFNGMGGQGSPFVSCTTGWRNTFKPFEVTGDRERGLVVYSRTIDAHTDLVLSPLRADGTRDLWIRQVAFPSGFGHVSEFHGTVRDL